MENHAQHINCPVCDQKLDASTLDRVQVPEGIVIHVRLEDALAKEIELAELREFKAEALFEGKTIDHKD